MTYFNCLFSPSRCKQVMKNSFSLSNSVNKRIKPINVTKISFLTLDFAFGHCERGLCLRSRLSFIYIIPSVFIRLRLTVFYARRQLNKTLLNFFTLLWIHFILATPQVSAHGLGFCFFCLCIFTDQVRCAREGNAFRRICSSVQWGREVGGRVLPVLVLPGDLTFETKRHVPRPYTARDTLPIQKREKINPNKGERKSKCRCRISSLWQHVKYNEPKPRFSSGLLSPTFTESFLFVSFVENRRNDWGQTGCCQQKNLSFSVQK